MTKAGMDYKNPEGVEAYTVLKNLCIIERNKSEGSRTTDKVSSPKMKPRSPRTKPKSVHKVADITEDDLEEMHDTGVFATSYHNTKWYPANLKFPCPLSDHKHELSTCHEFFSFSPVERWERMDKGKSCYACLSPKDACTDRKCGFENKVPKTLKCQGCAPWARSRKLAPFSILFCRINDHAKLRASFPDMKRDLEKYIGKLLSFNSPGFHLLSFNSPGFHLLSFNLPGFHLLSFNSPGFHKPFFNPPLTISSIH